MLCGYFDDSGSHEQSDHFVIAGYLADAEQWDRFNPLWLEVLARYGLTHMRMADFENRFQKADSEYGVVSRSQRKTLFYQLAAVIRCRVRFAIGGIVPMMGYREHIEGRYETQPGTLIQLRRISC